jgi:hypothetical protein
MENVQDRAPIKGFFRLNIEENGKIVGDSGWVENQITNLGYLNYLVKLIGKSSGSAQVGYVALGTGTAPNATHTTLNGEIMNSTQRKAVTFGSVSSTTAQFTATFASSDNFLTASANLSNIGLFATTATDDTLFAGNTYTSSTCGTNQNVNVTYQIRFS